MGGPALLSIRSALNRALCGVLAACGGQALIVTEVVDYVNLFEPFGASQGACQYHWPALSLLLRFFFVVLCSFLPARRDVGSV